MTIKYAKGHKMFFSVETPSVFREYEITEEPAKRSDEERRNMKTLKDLAERYGTGIHCTYHQRG